MCSISSKENTNCSKCVTKLHHGWGFCSVSRHQPKPHGHIFLFVFIFSYFGEKQGFNSTTRLLFDGEHSNILFSDANQIETIQNIWVVFPQGVRLCSVNQSLMDKR